MNANYNTAVRNWAYPVGVNAAFLTPRLSIKVSMTPRFLCQSYQEKEVPPPGTFYCNMECPYVGYLFSIVEYCRGEVFFVVHFFVCPGNYLLVPLLAFFCVDVWGKFVMQTNINSCLQEAVSRSEFSCVSTANVVRIIATRQIKLH